MVLTPSILSYLPVITFLMWKFFNFNGTTITSMSSTVFVPVLYFLKEAIFNRSEFFHPKSHAVFTLLAGPFNLTFLHVVQKRLSILYLTSHMGILITVLLTINATNQDFFSWSHLSNLSTLLTGNYYLYVSEHFTTYSPYLLESQLLWRGDCQNLFFRQVSFIPNKTNTVDFNPLLSVNSEVFNFVPTQLTRYPSTLITQIHSLISILVYSLLTWFFLALFLSRKVWNRRCTNF